MLILLPSDRFCGTTQGEIGLDENFIVIYDNGNNASKGILYDMKEKSMENNFIIMFTGQCTFTVDHSCSLFLFQTFKFAFCTMSIVLLKTVYVNALLIAMYMTSFFNF